ncbi:MAG TPA: mucoidy inhibitor MuiA family protein, partial [Marinobacter sp.]|nr:mucoidy inhibitor MuiA family protein [Marinobacter sp.]
MKKNLFVLAIAAVPISVAADITQATLYPSHGDLTWQETQTVQQGNGVITISRLPVSLQDQSVRVSLDGVAGAHIQQIEIGRVEQTGYISEQTQRLRNQLTQVLEQIQAQEDEIQAWNQQVILMTKAAENPHELSATELSDMAAALKQTTQAALAEIRGIRAQMRDNIALKDRLERELSQAQQNARASKTAQIHYRAPASGDLTITLEFQSNEARWRSEYNAQLNTQATGQQNSNQKSSELTLQHLAVVQQTTGDDWSNVELQLSTANARRGTNMPPLEPWVVSPSEPDLGARQMKSSAPMFSSTMAESQADSGASVERQSTFTQSYRLAQ